MTDLGDVPGLDPGIAAAVRVLRRAGVETFESCQGGLGHTYPEPAEGFRAVAVALASEDGIGLRVYMLRRLWRMEDGEPTGPRWEISFLSRSAR